MRIRPSVPADVGFLVEMARLASVVEDRPLPPPDDPDVIGMLPASPADALLAVDDDPLGAAWWHSPDDAVVAGVPELVTAVTRTPVAEASAARCSTPSPATPRLRVKAGSRSTSTSATRRRASTAAPGSSSRARAADPSASRWSGS
ncbi:MAG: hypothetical protein ABS81_18755 [Pseudonocardia sp. SCN 72-86]|nr:MAG: hypothetical protein ABS81_18755 [Pseudonocardia sp. SCN 72-86]